MSPLPAEGYVKKKADGSVRPIVVYDLRDRIVQRAILDTIIPAERGPRRQEAIASLYNDNSFGGIPERGVRTAVERANDVIKAGATHYVRTDIASYYSCVPRLKALDCLYARVPDTSLNALLNEMSGVRLNESIDVRTYRDEFPTHEKGIAQGNCLSPLLGNLLLCGFDVAMNTGAVVSLRYVDDVLLLGRSEADVLGALKLCGEQLVPYELRAYDPALDSQEKAQCGCVSDGVDFLGCTLSKGRILPRKKNRDAILKSVKEEFDKSLDSMVALKNTGNWPRRQEASLATTLRHVSDRTRAWTGAFQFCTNNSVLKEIDAEIDRLLRSYISRYGSLRKRGAKQYGRSILGVECLAEIHGYLNQDDEVLEDLHDDPEADL